MNISLLSSLQQLAKPNGEGVLPQLQTILRLEGRTADNVIDFFEAGAKHEYRYVRREMRHVR